MEAGKLDRRLRIERATETRNASYNSVVKTWSTYITVWGSKKDISDSERVRAQEVGAEITTRFQIRWSTSAATINPKDRLVYGGRTYDISGVKEINRRDGLEITATARADK